jgi:predicted TIM-barrel fold metal-dependent hydrolase
MTGNLIDVNVNLSRWPFRRLPFDTVPQLVKKLRSRGVKQAWAGSFDGLLHRDVAAVNGRLAALCKSHGEGTLLPFGTVNPALPDWEEDLRRCAEEHKMPGIRLHPNYHQYPLDDERFVKLLKLAGERNLIVQIAVLMEDERTQHPLVQVPHVNVAPLADALKQAPGARVVLLNAHRAVRGKTFLQMVATERVWFDISNLESVGGVAKILDQAPLEKILFGSHAPFFILESALLKLRESDLDEAQLKAISVTNAQKLLKA